LSSIFCPLELQLYPLSAVMSHLFGWIAADYLQPSPFDLVSFEKQSKIPGSERLINTAIVPVIVRPGNIVNLPTASRYFHAAS
ncbi:MAG TPA: hypothetical protein DCF63_16090, partial [Planctomycetaceae bacterium]|nr:hypothetical protein [Planctomycetaceae bacterium]